MNREKLAKHIRESLKKHNKNLENSRDSPVSHSFSDKNSAASSTTDSFRAFDL